jgi:threonine dehydrogenase-like Zn-dependent dehydrogenase
MRTLQVTGQRRFEIQDVAIPSPGPGEVLMRITAVTTCPQWDLHLRHNEPMFVGHRFHYPYTPGQPGHEATGSIEAVGPGVPELSPGDRVSAWRDPGHAAPGCYAQFVVHKAENVIRVPDGLPDESLAPLELAMCVGTVFRLLRTMDAVRGRVVGIAGAGSAGLISAQMARAEGAIEVIGFDPSPARREAAVRLGFDSCHDPNTVGTSAFPLRTGGSRLQTSIDCVGAKAAAEFLMDRTRDVVALFGVQREDFTFAVRHHSLTLCGYKGHHRESAEYAVRLITEGKLDLAPLVTHRLPLERYDEGIDLLERQEAVKVCFLPWAT